MIRKILQSKICKLSCRFVRKVKKTPNKNHWYNIKQEFNQLKWWPNVKVKPVTKLGQIPAGQRSPAERHKRYIQVADTNIYRCVNTVHRCTYMHVSSPVWDIAVHWLRKHLRLVQAHVQCSSILHCTLFDCLTGSVDHINTCIPSNSMQFPQPNLHRQTQLLVRTAGFPQWKSSELFSDKDKNAPYSSLKERALMEQGR